MNNLKMNNLKDTNDVYSQRYAALPEKAVASPSNSYSYTPKIRQQIISNKLINSTLYELYTIRKLHIGGAWLKANIKDGTIQIAKQTYIISWLDILPIDAYKEDAVVVSLRTPKFKDKNTKMFTNSYALVSKQID